MVGNSNFGNYCKKNKANTFNSQRIESIFNTFFVPENIFLILALFFGILLVFLTPPFQVPDENYHYYKSYQTSEFQIGTIKTGDTYGNYFPNSIIAFPKTVSPSENPFPYGTILSQIGVPLNQNIIKFFPFFNGNYSPIGYLPQAAGMLFGRLLNLSPFLLFYCGRLANFAVWIFLIYLAIRIIPFGKWLVVAISLMPMSLFESASLSIDAMNNGLCILFIAYVIYFAMNKNSENPLSKKEILLLLTMCIAITLIKGYFFLSFLLFIIPANAFSSKRESWFTIMTISLLSILTYILWQISNSSLLTTTLQKVSPHEQLQFILINPFEYGYILLNTFYLGWYGYSCSFIGVLGRFDLWLPQYIYFIFLLCLVVLAFIDNTPKISLNLKQKTICIIIFTILAGMMATGLFLTWTPIGASMISGIQGRYFIPIALLCFMFFNNFYPINPTIKKIVVLSIIVYITWVLFFALDAICNKYYSSQISLNHLTIILLLINAVILVCCYVHFNPIIQLPYFSKTKSGLPVFISVLIAIGLSLIFISIIVSTGNIGVSQIKADIPVGPIVGGVTAGQTFYSPYPNLNSIDVLLATYARANTKNVIFHLRDSPDSPNDIVSITINAREIQNNFYHNFKFTKISDSANKSYYFFIDSPESIPGDAITIWSIKENVYLQGSEYINSTPVSGDLAFKVRFAPL